MTTLEVSVKEFDQQVRCCAILGFSDYAARFVERFGKTNNVFFDTTHTIFVDYKGTRVPLRPPWRFAQWIKYGQESKDRTQLIRKKLAVSKYQREIYRFDVTESSSKAQQTEITYLEKLQRFETKHWYRSSPAALGAKKRAKFRCEVCEFDFEKSYGALGKEYLEAHHLRQVHLRTCDVAKITIDDLAALCANCHRMIHRLLKQNEASEHDQLEVLKTRLEVTK